LLGYALRTRNRHLSSTCRMRTQLLLAIRYALLSFSAVCTHMCRVLLYPCGKRNLMSRVSTSNTVAVAPDCRLVAASICLSGCVIRCVPTVHLSACSVRLAILAIVSTLRDARLTDALVCRLSKTVQTLTYLLPPSSASCQS
jgi:hypothetical protein